MPKKIRVIYQATFECDVVIEDDETLEDAVTNIDIPEGGRNGSVYCEDSFNVIHHD